MQIHLIRHGETNWNKEGRVQGQTDSVLTDLGKEQASKLQSTMAAYPIERVYCSSSIRTRETAALVFEGQEIPHEYCDNLREIYLGSWETRLYRDVDIDHPEELENFRSYPHKFAFNGAETFADLQIRGVEQINRIHSEAAAQVVAIVSHGAIIKTILSHYEGRHLRNLWDPPRLHNCAHSILEQNGDTFRITQYADLKV